MYKGNTKTQIIFSSVAVLLVAGACYPISDFIGYRSVALILMLTVSVLALRMRLAAVLAAATLSALVWDFFFIPPHFTLTIGSGEDALLLLMYFIIAVLSGVINHRIRQLEQVQSQKEEREHAIGLYNTLFDSLSHELRTPIAAILGASDTLSEQGDQLSPTQKKVLLEEISHGALRLSDQVEGLLSVSRIEAGMIRARKEWCDVSEITHGTLKKVAAALAEHRVDVFIPQDLPLVQLDYGLMVQILQNLLLNAAKYTPADTLIEIRANIQKGHSGAFVERFPDGTLSTAGDEMHHRLLLEIADHGPGFPQEEIPRVFDKFYRIARNVPGGTGLGLFIVKGFVEAQGGEVSLQDRAGGGAKFVIEIPTNVLS
jgi:two-component system, OmpR family, sensor histidine kinase KdpD